jgi:hypothetical protein
MSKKERLFYIGYLFAKYMVRYNYNLSTDENMCSAEVERDYAIEGINAELTE